MPLLQVLRSQQPEQRGAMATALRLLGNGSAWILPLKLLLSCLGLSITRRAMMTRRISFILPLLALPTLLGCNGEQAPAGPPPPSQQSLDSISNDPGAPRKQLARAIDGLFDNDNVGDTRAFVVRYGGRIVAERFASGYGKDTRFLGWSMSKCVTGIMIGLLVSDGRLRLNESAPVPAWQRSGDPRGEITLKQLLQMRSGLRHTEAAEPIHGSDTTQMLFLAGRDDMAAQAEAQPLEAEPGRKFKYSSATTVILSDLAAHSLTSSDDPDRRRKLVSDYLRTRLLEPAGMSTMIPEYDAAGTLIGSSMIHGTAHDWSKLGEFLRHKGSVRGAQVIPRRWIEFMRTPSPRNPGYGAHLWLNSSQSDGSEVLFTGKAPDDLFACIGNLGQYVIGSPGQKLVVVRLGHTESAKRPALRAALGNIIALYPSN